VAVKVLALTRLEHQFHTLQTVCLILAVALVAIMGMFIVADLE
jgi:hypothetical protein